MGKQGGRAGSQGVGTISIPFSSGCPFLLPIVCPLSVEVEEACGDWETFPASLSGRDGWGGVQVPPALLFCLGEVGTQRWEEEGAG